MGCVLFVVWGELVVGWFVLFVLGFVLGFCIVLVCWFVLFCLDICLGFVCLGCYFAGYGCCFLEWVWLVVGVVVVFGC